MMMPDNSGLSEACGANCRFLEGCLMATIISMGEVLETSAMNTSLELHSLSLLTAFIQYLCDPLAFFLRRTFCDEPE
jgi:hypothetical protein